MDAQVFCRQISKVLSAFSFILQINTLIASNDLLYSFSNRMLNCRKEVNELASETFEYIAFRLDWHGLALVSMFKKHIFLNDLDLETVNWPMWMLFEWMFFFLILQQLFCHQATAVLDILLPIYTEKEITKNITLLEFAPQRLARRLQQYQSVCEDKCPITKLKLRNFDGYVERLRSEGKTIQWINRDLER